MAWFNPFPFDNTLGRAVFLPPRRMLDAAQRFTESAGQAYAGGRPPVSGGSIDARLSLPWPQKLRPMSSAIRFRAARPRSVVPLW